MVATVSVLSVARSPKNEGDRQCVVGIMSVVVTLGNGRNPVCITIHQHVPHSGPHLQACRPMQPWNGSCPCNPFSSAAGPEWRPMFGCVVFGWSDLWRMVVVVVVVFPFVPLNELGIIHCQLPLSRVSVRQASIGLQQWHGRRHSWRGQTCSNNTVDG